MLKNNQAVPASDIWALGCMIFRMLTGDVPFSGSTDYQTFQMILERKLSFPPSIPLSNEARDLIEKLLQVEPYQRLGAGRQGSPNDYKALKSHAFFRGINFETVNTMAVPLDKRLPEEPKIIRQPSKVQMKGSGTNEIVH